MDNLLIRLLVGIVVAAVIVWLLGYTGIPGIIVGVVALIAFLVIVFGTGRLRV